MPCALFVHGIDAATFGTIGSEVGLVSPREVERALAVWRVAEDRLAQLNPSSADWQQALYAVEAARDRYQRIVGAGAAPARTMDEIDDAIDSTN